MDNLVFEESLNTEVEHSEFISKKYIFVNDNNNGNYSSQIVLDSTSLSNSGGYINWQESWILMPLVITLSTDTTANSANLPLNTNIADYSWAFKSGYWQMIDSMTVEFNNQNVIQTVPFTNVFRSFKANTTFSCDDIKNHGASTGFYPDTAGSWAYSQDAANADIASLSGRGVDGGITNNANGILRTVAIPSVAAATAGNVGYVDNEVSGLTAVVAAAVGAGAQNPNGLSESTYAINEGMKRRQEWTGYAGAGTYTANQSLNQSRVNSGANCSTVFRSVKLQTDAGCITWIVYAKLRLKDLADFFEKVPLLKGSTIRFLINTNQAITKFTSTIGAMTATTGVITTQPKLEIVSVNITAVEEIL